MKASVVFSLSLFSFRAYATTSPDGSCGGVNGYTCFYGAFGNCCSSSGWCGSTTAYCGGGCQTTFGVCSSPPAGQPISSNGQCGGSAGQTCTASTFGNCCSSSGWCGSTAAYCGTGCQPGFGLCPVQSSSTTLATTTTSTLSGPAASNLSKNGACGPAGGNATCQGSQWGNCCSSYGYCGSDGDYCSTGCLAGYGTCNPAVTTTTVASGIASGTATPSAIVCPDAAPQCLSNASIVCETSIANTTAIRAGGQSFVLEDCITLCSEVPGQLAGTYNPGLGIGSCSCLSAEFTTVVQVPYNGLTSFLLNKC